jgi:hypothetical protein
MAARRVPRFSLGEAITRRARRSCARSGCGSSRRKLAGCAAADDVKKAVPAGVRRLSADAPCVDLRSKKVLSERDLQDVCSNGCVRNTCGREGDHHAPRAGPGCASWESPSAGGSE